jgi:WD40 repeat protein
MRRRLVGAAGLVGALFLAAARAQGPAFVPGEKEPLLRLEGGGPTAHVTALAFSPDGKTLYAAGWDKVVRAWTLNARGEFVLDSAAYRVPLGPALSGALNCLAVSGDGEWLAAAGRSVFQGERGTRQGGWVVSADDALTDAMRRHMGTIYVFNTRTRAVRLLRGHLGPVLALAFAPPRAGKPPLLVSAARERYPENGRYAGVVRLWDVTRKGDPVAPLAGTGGLPDAESPRPALAAWHTGGAPEQVGVAIAWNDGWLRVWDADADPGQAPRRVRDYALNHTAALVPGRDELVTAGWDDGRIRLGFWDVAPGREVRHTAGPRPRTDDPFARALGLVASRGDGRADYAAVVTQKPLENQNVFRFSLHLVGLDADGADRGAEAPLWTIRPRQPVLATAPGGRHLAVAGNDAHEIWVYSTDDLLRGKAEPKKLQSDCAEVESVAFVTNGKELGLLLGEKGPGGPAGALVFDFAGRRLTDDRKGWEPSAPDPAGWRAERVADGDRPAVAVSDGGRPAGAVRLAKGQRVTAFALRPPAPRRPPLLAVAFEEGAEPVLALYDVRSGKMVRRLMAHCGPVHALAFSGDGRLLASASEDQTVCVWTLINLDEALRLGALPGVGVQEDGKGRVVVRKVRDDSPAAGKLRPDDVLEAVVEGGRPRPLAAATDFYEAVGRAGPGGTVTFRVGGADVAVPTEQGADERKPLLSLFITRGGGAKREWVGWTPTGPYDASDPRAEALLGWHFNTGDPAAPTRFARAGEYRKAYYREGLLKHLVARASLAPALEDWDRERAPLPPPRVGFFFDDAGQAPDPDDRGQVLVRHPNVGLTLTVLGRPVDSLAGLSWKFDKEPDEHALDLGAASGSGFRVPLELTRGEHRVRVTARTRDGGQTYVEERVIRYQPAAPVLRFAADRAPPAAVKAPELPLRLAVRPGLAGQAVRVLLTHRHEGKEITREEKAYPFPADPKGGGGAEEVLDRPLTLREGDNLVEVAAFNEGAPEKEREEETARLAFAVRYDRESPPPEVALAEVVASPPAPEGGRVPIAPGRPVVVRDPKVRIVGTVRSEKSLTRAEWGPAGRVARLTTLPGFKAGTADRLAVDVEAELEPGTNVLQFVAEAGGKRTERPLTLEYRPRTPTAWIAQPRPGARVNGEADEGEVPLEVRLTLPADRRPPFEGVVLVDDHEQAALAAPAEGEVVAKGKARLRPGVNRIQVRLRNRWGGLFTSDAVAVSYHRPPRILRLDGPDRTDRPAADVTARVRSPLRPRPELVRTEVNGRRRPVEAEVIPDAQKAGEWDVQLRGVPLEGGGAEGEPRANDVRVWVGNDEGESPDPGSLRVEYRPKQAPPAAAIVDPADDGPVNARRLAVHLRVMSKAPLRSVRLLRDADEAFAADVARLKPGPGGVYDIKAEVALAPDAVHRLRLEAVNDGGPASAERVVNFVRRPVTLAVEELVPVRPDGASVKPKLGPGGVYKVAKLPHGRVRLRGKVIWDEGDDERLTKARTVRVYVNGFQQLPAVLEPPRGGARERTFQVIVLLNQEGKNEVELSLRDALDADSRSRLEVPCDHPIRARRLHLLALSTVDKDREALEAQMLRVFQAGAGRPDFGVLPYGSLVGYKAADPDYVSKKVLQVMERIRELARAREDEPGTDVVVFYYRGRELVNDQGHFVGGDDRAARGAAAPSLPCDQIADLFAEAPGAHLLLFDVDHDVAVPEGRDKLGAWPDPFPDLSHHVAVVRYAWMEPAGAPRDARLNLIRAVQEAIGQTTLLLDVTERVHENAKKLSTQPGVKVADKVYVPPAMGRVELTRAP